MENLIAAKIEKSLNLADLASQNLALLAMVIALALVQTLARFYLK